jgi:hypothetical protein
LVLEREALAAVATAVAVVDRLAHLHHLLHQ